MCVRARACARVRVRDAHGGPTASSLSPIWGSKLEPPPSPWSACHFEQESWPPAPPS